VARKYRLLRTRSKTFFEVWDSVRRFLINPTVWPFCLLGLLQNAVIDSASAYHNGMVQDGSSVRNSFTRSFLKQFFGWHFIARVPADFDRLTLHQRSTGQLLFDEGSKQSSHASGHFESRFEAVDGAIADLRARGPHSLRAG
jgi:hypothetical protein